jgi:hypothetical protein
MPVAQSGLHVDQRPRIAVQGEGRADQLPIRAKVRQELVQVIGPLARREHQLARQDRIPGEKAHDRALLTKPADEVLEACFGRLTSQPSFQTGDMQFEHDRLAELEEDDGRDIRQESLREHVNVEGKELGLFAQPAHPFLKTAESTPEKGADRRQACG